ncbi:DNA polymerase [Nocardia ninae]|uniref:DNA polymerase I n=1 Tax=Nocardia ninae NBRC 108245 TaxID=1210091 RepID=A0A511MJS5_9NOCA|nr:DNA polymerase [Nocardia ninae]GEM40892.1 hypothetical protein NN4_54110 [Nocardia ninae NBRC 108245]
MKELSYRLRGEPVYIRIPETDADLTQFSDWIDGHKRHRIGIDTETTGLDIYSAGYRLRTVQFGTGTESWVVTVEKGQKHWHAARLAVARLERVLIHNASFDLQVLEKHLGVPMSDMWPRTTDTQILAHLVDPRGQEEGGTGHKLEQLTRALIDPVTADEVKGLMPRLAKKYKTNKELVWKVPELLDDPEFMLYAGMDPVLARRLWDKLEPKVPHDSVHLISYEHELARVCTEMERTGFLLDTAYTEQFSAKLRTEEDEAAFHALAFFGVENVNSTEQVADALEELGVRIKARTETGKRKVDKDLLEQLAEDDPQIGSVGHLVAAVSEAKRAGKWRTTWIDGFLRGADPAGRVHPSINPLRARTARMSITGIPAQTLPSSNWTVRRCFIADPGQTVVSVDYQAQELRVLAALSRDPTMRRAFADGADLHQMTGDAAGVARPVGKMANFLQVYGGGAGTLSQKAGITFPAARRVIEGFERTYPKVAILAKKLENEAKANGFVTTPVGRRLPVDSGRWYAALNYVIQSTSRDVTGRGLLALDAAGWTPYMRLPMHDEVVASLPIEHAEWGATEIARHMRMDLHGVDIDTDPEVYGPSWGHGYMKAAA